MITTTKTVVGRDGTVLVTIITVNQTYPAWDNGVHFLTPDHLPLQAAVIGHEKAGTGFEPHYHPPVERTIVGTPELLMIVAGSYRLTVFETDGTEVESLTVRLGDVIVLVSGGHGMKALENESGMFEVKVGPYLGSADKVWFTTKQRDF